METKWVFYRHNVSRSLIKLELALFAFNAIFAEKEIQSFGEKLSCAINFEDLGGGGGVGCLAQR